MKKTSFTHLLDGESMSTEDVIKIINNNILVDINNETEKNIADSREFLNKLVKENKVIYGVNTGMGGFVNWLVSTDKARKLQENLINAVATNVGPYLDDMVVRASMLVRINSLARGKSAISLENFRKLVKLFNSGVIPCIPAKGSLGASGDLGPLACIALVAIGKWKAKFQGKIISGKEALEAVDIEPMELSYKEGLSLINGTSTMVGYGSILVEKTIQLLKLYDVISCLSFEGLNVKSKPFNPIVHREKKHQGQLRTAENIWRFLLESEMIADEDAISANTHLEYNIDQNENGQPIEDAYSIRCTPQIVGPIKDSLKVIKDTLVNEINSSSDNPLIFSNEEDVFHNGHFHGQYISMAMDHLSISLTTLSNLSDRRIDRFMDKNNSNGLPPFLCSKNPGLRLGLMGGQFMATSLTAESRSLCIPISTQSLTSTGDFQDIVSLGLVGARRANELYENTAYVIAFELLCAAQAAEIRGAHLLSNVTKKLFDLVREVVPYFSEDVYLTEYLEELADKIKSGEFLESIEKTFGEVIF